jgi:hypothetical protein
LERFRQEYEKLYKLLISSHENEKRLLKKCKELNSDIGNLIVSYSKNIFFYNYLFKVGNAARV